MTTKIRHAVWATAVLFVLLGGLVAWIYRPISFDSSVWKQESKHRPQMVDDLLISYELKEMSRKQVEQLLGKPTGHDSIQGNRYIYWAGYAGIDDMWLEIQFDGNQVAEVHHRPD